MPSSLATYTQLAQDLVTASNDEAAVRKWAAGWAPATAIDAIAEFAHTHGSTPTGAQFVLARLHGFEGWPEFAAHLTALAAPDSQVSRFETAADAIVNGDLVTLKRLLREEPGLVRARSTRLHHAPLLHYVSANGVEDYRQKTPSNIVEIAAALLDAGAEVDAAANVYGSQCKALDLTATSAHPERAGVQLELLDLLLARGAKPEPAIVTAALANGRGRAAEFLAARGTPLDFASAAGTGRLDLVQTLFPAATDNQRRDGFLFACQYGRNDVLKFLLDHGADLSAHDPNGQTALHWAVIGGHLDTVELLLLHHAPLHAKNVYGGTVLGQALWSGAPRQVIDALLAAGARPPA